MDLVERRGGGGAHLVGAPQLLDRPRERAARGRLVARHARALVEVAQAREDARELLDRRAPPGLGRVRGHDEPQLGAGEHLAQLVGGGAALGEVLDRGAQRAGAGRVGVRALAAAQAAHALVVLGEVEELEPARERAHEDLRGVERERGDELLELARGGVLARPRALAERGGALVQRDRVLALARRQHRGEELQQQRAVVDEGPPAEIAEGRAGGLRGHPRRVGGRPPRASARQAKMWRPRLARMGASQNGRVTPLAPGDVFGGFRIEAVAGRGGMGVVYRAVQLDLGRPVALKLIASDRAADPAFRERFQRESRMAAAIDHPNVVPVHGAGEEDGQLYLVMRFVPGTDLHRLVKHEGPLAPLRAAAIVAQVASALDAAHAAGLVHRDVKPANVLLAGDHAYLSDFGLTRLLSSEEQLTETGQWLGTTDFSSPEQLQGERVDARADVYSLGCVLHAALLGGPPYPRATVPATLLAHLQDPPPRPSESGAPAGFDRVMARALAKAPRDRYPSAGDLGRAALAAARGEPSPSPSAASRSARPRPAPPRTATPARRRRVTVAQPPDTRVKDEERTEVIRPPRRSRRALVGGVVAVAALGTAAALAGIPGGGGSGDPRRAAVGRRGPRRRPGLRPGLRGRGRPRAAAAADARRAARAADRGGARPRPRRARVRVAVPRAEDAGLRAREPRGPGRPRRPRERRLPRRARGRPARSRAGSSSAWCATAGSRGSG